MRCKAIVFVLGAFISMGVMNTVNKIDILFSEMCELDFRICRVGNNNINKLEGLNDSN